MRKIPLAIVLAFIAIGFLKPVGAQQSTNPIPFTNPTNPSFSLAPVNSGTPAGAIQSGLVSTSGGATITTAGAIRSSLPGTTSGSGGAGGIGRLLTPAGLTGAVGIGRLAPPGNNPNLSVGFVPVYVPSAASTNAALGLTNSASGLPQQNSIAGFGANPSGTSTASGPSNVSGTGSGASNTPPNVVQTNPTSASGGISNPTGASGLRGNALNYQQ
jgi:hypothetical protein